MAEEHVAPVDSAKLLLPVVMLGMLCLMLIMYYYGGDNGVKEYQVRDTGHATTQASGH